MTDLEKYEELLNSFGLEYVKDQQKDSTLIYLAEPDSLSFNFDFIKYNSGKLIKDHENSKIDSYSSFYCYFSFDETGKFNQVGIFE